MNRGSTRLLLAGALLAWALACSSPEEGAAAGGSDAGSGSTAGPSISLDPPDAGGDEPGDGDDPEQPSEPGVELHLDAVSPARGSSAGGLALTLTGSGFYKGFSNGSTAEAQARTRLIVGGTQVEAFRILGDRLLEATLPPGQAGPADVVLMNPNGEVRCEACFTYFDALSLEGLSPTSGASAGGERVVLSGKNFGDDLVVLMGASAAPIVERFSDEAVVLTPAFEGEGPVPVIAFGQGGRAELPRGFTYVAALSLQGAAPRAIPLGGGVEVALTGAGFERASALTIGGQRVAFRQSGAAEIRFEAPSAPEVGAVEVALESAAGERATLPGGLLYVDPDGASPSEGAPAFQLIGVFPTHGPAAGGGELRLVGARLGEVARLWLGEAEIRAADLRIVEDAIEGAELAFTLPPGPAGTRVSLMAEDGAGRRASLDDAFRYTLSLDGISPSSGDPAGGEWVELRGAGFSGGLSVRFGAAASPEVCFDPETPGVLRARTGAGAGQVAVEVIDPDDALNRARIERGFTYLAPLKVGAVSPASGAISGGERVRVLGAGFAPGTVVEFGGERLRDLEVLSANEIEGRAPKGAVGSVDVVVRRSGATDRLIAGYAYFDPASSIGGSSGEPLSGALYVTAAYSALARIPGVTVTVGPVEAPLARGLTDENGQVSFRVAGLDRPVRVTLEKEGHMTMVVEAQASSRLTVFMSRTYVSGVDGIGLPGSSAAAGGSTAMPEYGVSASTPIVSGRVTGFKLPRALREGEIAMAEVWVVPTTPFATPPFGTPSSAETRDARGERWRVTSDGGPYSIFASAGRLSVYALFGIYDTQTGVLTPHLLGLRRGVVASAEQPALAQDIQLDMHLDQSLEIFVDTTPSDVSTGVAGGSVTNQAFAWLEVGSDGYIPFQSASVASERVVIGGLPRLDAGNFLFLNRSSASTGYPESYCLRRATGALGEGLTLGPMIGFAQAALPAEATVTPEAGQEERAFEGEISWDFGSGGAPDLMTVYVTHSRPGASSTILYAVVPGSQRSLALPANLAAAVDPQTDVLSVSYQASRSPRFDYDFWSYSQMSLSAWSCWSSGSFTVPVRR